ncbi:MAG TPA: S8 family serine peptidase, partial [Gaiellaceae bacterium]|nr:S8 family serine peptidase [Gaiellaceae bacterium]
PQAPLAEAQLGSGRGLTAYAVAHNRLDLRAPASVSYLRTLATAQRQLAAHITAAIPQARVRWHYSLVANGLAVVVPRSQLATLRSIGATVWPSLTYHALLNRTPQLIGAPTVWGPTLATAGQGMKIAIIDDGLDQTHVFFDPTGFTYPAGFPKGNTSYTTPKVIVARAFAPATPQWQYADIPFDPKYSDHATNVAGIAAGDHGTTAQLSSGKFSVSGIAPMAYLGNYKVLTIPTQSFGLDGNSPEILAGIEQAVRDGMDVLNLSLGEPEVEPTRDIVVNGLNAAAEAGVVPVVAAGNDFAEAGHGSISSPANASEAIAVAASTEGDTGPADEIADFSSGGPTPVSLQMKPDVTAPGVDLLSSLPHNQWSEHSWSGTSMATPHVAGAAAVLKQRHPTWTVEQIKSALESTGDPVRPPGSTGEVSPTREGGGRIDLPRADNPLIFTNPTSLSFGLVQHGANATLQLAVTDAGSGPVPWTVSLDPATTVRGATLTPTLPTVVPGSNIGFTLTVAADAAEGEGTGFILLTRALEMRRIPYWFRVEVPKLSTEKQLVIKGPGLYGGDTAGKASLVSSYRYPDGVLAPGLPINLSGPEEVFRFVLKKPVANFGAVVTSHGNGVRVSPRLVSAADENRLVGYAGMPVDLNPYAGFNRLVPAVAAILPQPGTFDFVFDTPAGGKPGRFTFRVWVDDTTPPTVRMLVSSVVRGTALRVGVSDGGSGVDGGALQVKVDGATVPSKFSGGVVSIPTSTLARGVHKLTVVAADYQETKNMEDVGPILPNTTTLNASFVVR